VLSPTDFAFGRSHSTWSIAPSTLLVLLVATSGCQSGPSARSGYLSSYDGLLQPGQMVKKGMYRRRDDASSDAIGRVFIEPAVLAPGLKTELSREEQAMVLREVDRQICFEVSERFPIAQEPMPDAGRVRTAVVSLASTSRSGSAASAAAGFFIPVPIVRFRVPGTTGGVAAESELLTSDGRQAAAVAVRRKAQIVGRTRPSLSKAGDALQMAEPLGDAVGATFASKTRQKIKLGKVDPCGKFGPRRNVKRSLGNVFVGRATGLYVPQVAGTGGRDGDDADPRVQTTGEVSHP